MVNATVELSGGSASNSNVTLGKIGHGLMTMTWVPTAVPDEQCFEAIKASLDRAPAGGKMLLNGSEFYGPEAQRTLNLDLVARFFEKYPTYADKAFLSVKGGTKAENLIPDGSPENLRRSVDASIAALRGTKKIDLFEAVRVDPGFPIEDQIKTLVTLQREGKFDFIGVSECSAASVKRANAIAHIALVEIEVSPSSYEEETKAVISTCKDLGIAIAAYSPIGRGFLTGKIQKAEDYAVIEGDVRRNFSRFKKENMEHNLAFVKALSVVAEKKGVTTGQLSIAWVSSRGPHVIPLPGSSNIKRTLENVEAADITLTAEEIKDVDQIIESHTVIGGRYIDEMESHFFLWG